MFLVLVVSVVIIGATVFMEVYGDDSKVMVFR